MLQHVRSLHACPELSGIESAGSARVSSGRDLKRQGQPATGNSQTHFAVEVLS